MYKIFPEKQKTRPCVRITELKFISWTLIRKQNSDLIERWRGWCYHWGWCYPGARTGRDWSRDRAACSRVWLLTNTDSRRREKAPQSSMFSAWFQPGLKRKSRIRLRWSRASATQSKHLQFFFYSIKVHYMSLRGTQLRRRNSQPRTYK